MSTPANQRSQCRPNRLPLKYHEMLRPSQHGLTPSCVHGRLSIASWIMRKTGFSLVKAETIEQLQNVSALFNVTAVGYFRKYQARPRGQAQGSLFARWGRIQS